MNRYGLMTGVAVHQAKDSSDILGVVTVIGCLLNGLIMSNEFLTSSEGLPRSDGRDL